MQDSNGKISMYACIGMEIQMWKLFSFRIEYRTFNFLHYNNKIKQHVLENKNKIIPTLSLLDFKSV